MADVTRAGQGRSLVLQSIETPDGDRCVDIFHRGDGSFGFEGYRRDYEDTGGWYRISDFGGQRYDTEAQARAAAGRVFAWAATE